MVSGWAWNETAPSRPTATTFLMHRPWWRARANHLRATKRANSVAMVMAGTVKSTKERAISSCPP